LKHLAVNGIRALRKALTKHPTLTSLNLTRSIDDIGLAEDLVSFMPE
ncbi:6630_t:CDS:1, partial [Racocetra fulgida]